ncbi:MAG: hypothetical protein P8N31_12085 [Planctomycetota bacterium]|nr:hypothetical protein [Planctomycetota bacterium]
MKQVIPILFAVLFLVVPASRTDAAPAALEAPAPTEDDCASCGKTIYFGKRCLTCIAKEAKANRSHPCATCEKPILLGDNCAICTYNNAKRDLAHKCTNCDEVIYLGSTCAACTKTRLQGSLGELLAKGAELTPLAKSELDRLLARLDFAEPGPATDEQGPKEAKDADDPEAATPKTLEDLALDKQVKLDYLAEVSALETFTSAAAEYAEKTGKVIGETATDLKLKQRATTVVGAAVATAKVLEETKRKVAVSSFTMLGRVPVHTELGWTSLSDLAAFKLLEVAPEMQGTDLAKDPAAVLASLVVADHMYLLMDLKLVATEAGPVSVVNYLAEKGSKDPAKTLAATTALVSVRKIRAGQELSRSIRDLARAIEVLSNTAEEETDEIEAEAPGEE